MLDGDGEHEGTASAVLRHLAGGVRIALHEGHEAGGGERGVLHGRAFGADVREVVADAAAPLHELHLLLVDTDHGAVRVGVALDANHEAVRERGDLMVVADARHGASLRHDVAEVVEEFEELVFGQRVGILALHAGDLACQAAVHVGGRLLIDVPVSIFQCVLVDPDFGGQFVASEVVERCGVGLVKGVRFRLCAHEVNLFH